MIHIMLMIFKIIGIILLVVAAVLLAAVFAVLFVPVRYRLEGDKFENDGAFLVQGRASWLLHLLSVRGSFDGEVGLKVRVCGFVVYDIRKKEAYAAKKAAKEKKKEEKERRQKQRKKARRKADRESRKKAGRDAAQEKQRLEKTAPVRQDAERRGAKQRGEAAQEQAADTGSKMGFRRRLKAFFTMLMEKLKNIRYTICGFCDKIKQIRDNIEYYRDVLAQERSKAAFERCKKQLSAIWRNVRPKKLKLAVHAGFDDPSVTGQVLAWYSMAYPWIYPAVTLRADFERSVLAGTFFLKGRITLFVLLRAAWILYFDKDIRYFLRLWKKEETING